MNADQNRTTIAQRIQSANALLRGADAALLRAEADLRTAIERAASAKATAHAARGVVKEIYGDIEYCSWTTELVADAEMRSWGHNNAAPLASAVKRRFAHVAITEEVSGTEP